MDKDFVRQQLPKCTASLFDDIVYSKVLGASKQTNLICCMLSSIMDVNEDIESKKEKVINVSEFFKMTRGQNSRAIYNSICELISSVLPLFDDDRNVDKIKKKIECYQSTLKDNVCKAAHYASTLCTQFEKILIFDYSSTVDCFISELKEKKTIYILESRALDGGRPFLKRALECGHDVHFVPDTTMLVVLKKCQAAFIGAETIYPDGSIFNTVGADILGVLCKEYNIPLYVISPMVKIDIRNKYGYTKTAPMPYDYSVRLASDWSESERKNVDFRSIKLVKIESKYINGIITESGIIPSSSMYIEAEKYEKKLEI